MRPATSHFYHRNNGAFTLTELLVVIVIIGVLAAIFIPVVSLARASANTSRCAANLRQIGAAVHLYAADNKGWLPPAIGSNGISILSRGGPLAPYLGPYNGGTPLDLYFKSAPVVCPAAESLTGTGNFSYNYVSNVDILGYPAGGYRQRRMNEVGSPSGKIIMAEGTSSFASSDASYIKAWNTGGVLLEVHGQHLNVLFLDTHVEHMAIVEITKKQVTLN